MKSWMVVFGMLLLLSCMGSKKQAGVLSWTAVKKITVTKLPCFGFCPEYELTIQSNGMLLLNAKAKVKNDLKGNYHSVLKPVDRERIINSLKDMNFLSLKSKMGDRSVSDLPSTETALVLTNGQTKKVLDYGNRGTAELERFYKMIEHIIDTQEWTAGLAPD